MLALLKLILYISNSAVTSLTLFAVWPTQKPSDRDAITQKLEREEGKRKKRRTADAIELTCATKMAVPGYSMAVLWVCWRYQSLCHISVIVK